MMGMQVQPAQLFYEFRLDDHVPGDHLLRRIDRFLGLESVRSELRPFYSTIGRPSIDPGLMMRMLIVGYCMGIRSERRLCEEVHLNLAYRWFCRLGLDGRVPDHSTFSRNRHGRFRQSDTLQHLFETVVERCLREGELALRIGVLLDKLAVGFNQDGIRRAVLAAMERRPPVKAPVGGALTRDDARDDRLRPLKQLLDELHGFVRGLAVSGKTMGNVIQLAQRHGLSFFVAELAHRVAGMLEDFSLARLAEARTRALLRANSSRTTSGTSSSTSSRSTKSPSRVRNGKLRKSFARSSHTLVSMKS